MGYIRIGSAVVLAIALEALISCGGAGTVTTTPPTTPTNFTVQLGPETSVLTTVQRSALGLQYGPPDGTLGVLLNAGTYTFFAPARSYASSPGGPTCAGSPGVEGTYRLGGTLSSFTAQFGCSAVIRPSTNGDPNGYTFDRDYAGGGPVLAVSSNGQSGILHIYHGEYHGGTCSGLGQCFYASLGMAFSTDGGATFKKLGEIIQPYVTRSSILNANTNLDVGGGTLVLADINGKYVANVSTADPSTVYIYVFFSDRDPSATSSTPCNTYSCIAVARAKLSDVLTAAFAGNSAVFPTLFTKYSQGAFTQPATGGDPNAATNSGHYTPVVPEVGSFPSVLYDGSTQQFLMVYTTGNNAVVMRHGATLLSWSDPIASGAIQDGTNSILYTTLVGDGADPTTGAGNPWLFYIRSTTWPDWPDTTVVNRRVQLSLQ